MQYFVAIFYSAGGEKSLRVEDAAQRRRNVEDFVDTLVKLIHHHEGLSQVEIIKYDEGRLVYHCNIEFNMFSLDIIKERIHYCLD